jgi:hypothetical protein
LQGKAEEVRISDICKPTTTQPRGKRPRRHHGFRFDGLLGSAKSKSIDEFARIFLQGKAEEVRISDICKPTTTQPRGKRPAKASWF